MPFLHAPPHRRERAGGLETCAPVGDEDRARHVGRLVRDEPGDERRDLGGLCEAAERGLRSERLELVARELAYGLPIDRVRDNRIDGDALDARAAAARRVSDTRAAFEAA